MKRVYFNAGAAASSREHVRTFKEGKATRFEARDNTAAIADALSTRPPQS